MADVVEIHDEDEWMTATQILDACRSPKLSGERRLILEVLAGAINIAVGTGGHLDFLRGRSKGRAMREAGEWIAGKPAGTWKLSFAFCCEALDIEPSYLRRGIMRMVTPYVRKRPMLMTAPLKIGSQASH